MRATCDGVEGYVEPLGGRRFRLRGGAEWLLADERMLREATESLGGELLEPLKTVVVHGARSMAVWCVRKRVGSSLLLVRRRHCASAPSPNPRSFYSTLGEARGDACRDSFPPGSSCARWGDLTVDAFRFPTVIPLTRPSPPYGEVSGHRALHG